MLMTFKNKNLVMIKKLYKEAVQLEYIPHEIKVSKKEIREIVNELCFYKNKHYSLVYNDRRREGGSEEGIASTLASACLQFRPNEIADMLINDAAKLVYRDNINIVVKKDSKPEPEVLMEATQEDK